MQSFSKDSIATKAISLRLHILIIVFIFILPFFTFYWMVPFIGKYTIGNDYTQYWIQQQLFLQFSIKDGSFPLYAPGWSGGWTASGLTLGQVWHPISFLASHVPGYWNGYAFEIVTWLRLLSFGAAQVVLFWLFQKFRLRIVWALAISYITVYNLRIARYVSLRRILLRIMWVLFSYAYL